MSTRPVVPRDGRGNYKLPDPQTMQARSWPRCTSVVKRPADVTALNKWKLRTALQGASAKPELLDVMRTASTKGEMDAIAEAALEAGGANKASGLGTRLHEITEQVDANEGRDTGVVDLTVDDLDLLPDVAAYINVTRGAGIEYFRHLIERVVVNEKIAVAGTFDRIVRLPDGRYVMADVKTGQNLDYGWLEISAQLAAYANASAMWTGRTEGDIYEEMPEVDLNVGLVFHVPVGRGECHLYLVDIARGWEVAQLAYRIGEARTMRDLAQMVTPAELVGDKLLASIRACESVGQLEQLWSEFSAGWRNDHTEAARQKKSQLLAV